MRIKCGWFSLSLLVIFILPQFIFSFSPSYPYTFHSVDDGLPQSVITVIYEDSFGYIWIGTNEGVARFNGTSFDVYNETTGYPFWLVVGIIEVEPGKLWIATFNNGLWELYHGKAKRIEYAPEAKQQQIHHLVTTPDSTVLLVTEPGGVYELKNEKVILHIPDTTGFIENIAITATKDPFGNIWVGTYKNGVQVFQEKRRVIQFTTADGLPSNEIRSILISAKHQAWIGTNKGLWVQNAPELSKQFNQQFSFPFIPHIYSANGEDIWVSIATGDGGVVHLRNGTITQEIRPRTGLAVRYAFITRSNILMLGTYRGLFVFPNQNFTNYDTNSGFIIPYIRAIVRDHRNTLYVGTRNDGLYIFRNRAFHRLNQLDPVFKLNAIYCLTPVNNQLWIGTTRGLFILNNERLIQTPLTRYFSSRTIRRFYKEKQHVYIILRDSVYRYDIAHPYKSPQNINYNLKPPRLSIWGIQRDRTGTLCLITNGQGMYRLQDSTWVPVSTPHPIQKIFAIRKGPQGNLYLATSRGVFLWDGQQVRPVLSTTYTIWDLLPTSEGIWLLTSKGLQHFQNNLLSVYTRKDGLVTTEFNMGAVFADSDSSLWFGGVDGLVRYKKQVDYPTTFPPVYITRIMSADTTIYFPRGNFRFPYTGNNVKINFDWINFGNRYALTLGYFLEGFDTDTTRVSNTYQASYTNLPPGRYTFHIFLINAVNNNILNDTAIHIQILSPWWQTPWFRILSVFSLILLGYFIVQWRTALLKKRARQLEETVARRTREIEQSKLKLEKEIEERRKIQASLDKERQLLATTLKSITDGVITTDLDGDILLINTAAEKLIGISGTDVLFRNINDVCDIQKEETDEPIRLPDDIEKYQAEVDSKQYLTAKIKHHPSGEFNSVALNWAIIKNEKQQKVGYVWVIRDLSVERQLEQEIIKTQKLESIGLLAGGIAHDFNNILTGIIGNAQLAKLKIQMGDTNISPYLEGIEKATENATRLTHQLLTFAKGGEPIKDLLSIKELLEEAVEFALTGTKIRCKLNIAEDLWLTRADKGQITQVINNLVINAVQAMPDGGTLTITAHNVEKSKHFTDYPAIYDLLGEYFIKLEFEDTGIGIPKENLARIFDPYFTTKKTGTGLGLATAYSIIKKHGGKLLVDSELGKGTCFTIYLPATRENPKSSTDDHTHLFDGRGMSVLVMDDDTNILDIVVHFLSLMGFQVDTAIDGATAIQMYREAYLNNRPYDFCLLDLTVRGGIGGVETAKEIRKINPNAIIIVASGYSMDSALANYEAFGFAGRITKPFSLERFNRLLNEIFQNKNVT